MFIAVVCVVIFRSKKTVRTDHFNFCSNIFIQITTGSTRSFFLLLFCNGFFLIDQLFVLQVREYAFSFSNVLSPKEFCIIHAFVTERTKCDRSVKSCTSLFI